jgi:hypothetical protein
VGLARGNQTARFLAHVIPTAVSEHAHSGLIRARFWREWAERVSRPEGPCVCLLNSKHKVPRSYSPAEESAGSLTDTRDDETLEWGRHSSARLRFVG